MRMGDGRSQGVGSVGLRDATGGQQALDHELHLLLAGMAGAHHAFLDVVGGIFGDLEPCFRRRQQRHGAGMADLQRGLRIAGDEGLLHSDGSGAVALNDFRQGPVQQHQPHAQAIDRLGGDHAMGDMAEARARNLDHAPTHGRQAGIQAENANRQGHERFVPLTFGLAYSLRYPGTSLPAKSSMASAISRSPITTRLAPRDRRCSTSASKWARATIGSSGLARRACCTICPASNAWGMATNNSFASFKFAAASTSSRAALPRICSRLGSPTTPSSTTSSGIRYLMPSAIRWPTRPKPTSTA